MLPANASELPSLVHAKLMSWHASALNAAGVNTSDIAPPSAVLAGYWSHSAEEVMLPGPEPLSNLGGDDGPVPPCVANMTSKEYAARKRGRAEAPG